jgi:MFS family permease
LRDPNPRRLLIMSFIDSLGTGLYLAGSVIFFTQKVKLGAAEVGLGLSIASVVGLAGVLPAGWVAQRLGTWQTLLVFDVWRAIGFTSYIFVRSFPWFLAVVCFLAIPEQAFNPLSQHLVEQVVGPEKRVVMMGKIRTVYNVGFTVSAPLSGLAVKLGTATSYNSLMIGDALSYVVAGVLLWRLRGVADAARRVEVSHRQAGKMPKTSRFSVEALRDRTYRNAVAINSVMSLHLSILSIGIPLWITQHTHVPKYLVGPLFVINTALVIPLQVPVSAMAKNVARSIGLIRVAGLALVACCLLLAAAATLPLVPAILALAGAVAVLTLAEIAQSAGGWTLAYELAPTAARAEALTAFGLGISAQFVVGPILLTGAVIAHGSLGWVVLSAVFLVFTLVTPAMIRFKGAGAATTRPGG